MRSCLEIAHFLAVEDVSLRRGSIVQLLEEEGFFYERQSLMEGSHRVENICLPFSPGPKRLVLGAHYDCVSGSTGANDNASGVAVLLCLARMLQKHGVRNAEIVFFDREEREDHGSAAYIKAVGPKNIGGAVTVDMCGYGDTLLALTKGNENHPQLGRMLEEARLKRHGVLGVQSVPFRFGDDDTFDSFGVPNIALTTMPADEAAFTQDYLNRLANGGAHTQADLLRYRALSYSKSMHGGSLDSVDSLCETALERTLAYLTESLLEGDL